MPARSSSLPGSHEETPESAQADQVGEKVRFHCQEEGCIKTFQALASLQSYLDVGTHMVRLVIKRSPPMTRSGENGRRHAIQWVVAMLGVIQLPSTPVTKQRLAKSWS